MHSLLKGKCTWSGIQFGLVRCYTLHLNFKNTGGEELAFANIKDKRGKKHYLSISSLKALPFCALIFILRMCR